MMIATDLLNEIREVLLACAPLASNRQLAHLFVDERLGTWRDLAPEGNNRQERANATIFVLLERMNRAGENALVLFLHVLADQFEAADACRPRLQRVAERLSAALAAGEGKRRAPASEPAPIDDAAFAELLQEVAEPRGPGSQYLALVALEEMLSGLTAPQRQRLFQTILRQEYIIPANRGRWAVSARIMAAIGRSF